MLAPSGGALLAERVTRPGARAHAAHGLTHAQAEDLVRELTAAGFTGVLVQTRQARRRTLVILQGSYTRPADRTFAGAVRYADSRPAGRAGSGCSWLRHRGAAYCRGIVANAGNRPGRRLH